MNQHGKDILKSGLWSLVVLLLALGLIYALCTQKNQALALIEPGYFQWLKQIVTGHLPSDASTDDLGRDLRFALHNSILSVSYIYLTTIVLTMGIGATFHHYRHHPQRLLHSIALWNTVTLLPPFLIYYLSLKFHLLPFMKLSSGGKVEVQFSEWFWPILIFAVFNSYFVKNIVAVQSLLDDVLQRPFTRFYRGKGASFLQLLWHTKRNWLYPLLAVFLFFFPFALAESVIFEFLFGFQGLGKLLWYASDFDTNLEAVRIFTPKLMALTGVFVLISQISRWIHLVMMKEEL